MKKLLSLTLAIGLLAILLTACYPAIINTKMELNADGSGKRTFIAEVLKDGVPNPDNPTDPAKNVSGMFTDPGYFPSGMQAAVDYLNTVRPTAVSAITMEEKTDRYVMTYTMDFESIDDFNTKMKTLTAGLNWTTEEIAEATFVKVDAGDNQSTITYTEDISLVNIATLWMSHALWNSPVADKVFDKAYAQGQFNWEKHYNDDALTQYAMFFTNDVTVKIGTEEKLFPKNSTEILFAVTLDNPITPTPTLAPTQTPTSTVAPTTPPIDENPTTNDTFGIAVTGIILMCISSVIIISAFKKRNNKAQI
ncbi:MAG: hypothetical protein ACYCYI_03100 [Saccharofermentanales bacterium]